MIPLQTSGWDPHSRSACHLEDPEVIEARQLKRPPVFGAAIISLLGIYCPMGCTAFGYPVPLFLLRGAVFSMFPGMALRSWRLALKGVVAGAVLETAYSVFWAGFLSRFVLQMHWEPRNGFNEFLALWLPGRFGAGTHMGSLWPNSAQFVIGILVWFNVMLLAWWWAWTPRLPLERMKPVYKTANISVAVACVVLWILSPMDHWWHAGAHPWPTPNGLPWLLLFLGTFPVCGVLIARSLRAQTEQGVVSAFPVVEVKAIDDAERQ